MHLTWRRGDSYHVAKGAVPRAFLAGPLVTGYVFFSAVGAVYGICAVQYGFYNFLGPYGPFGKSGPGAEWARWNDQIMMIWTGSEFAEGAGSTTLAQTERYGRYYFFMSPHQICGGIMVMCAIIQMNSFFRTNGMQKWHRISGRVYTVAHVFNLYGSLGFLITHTFPHVWPEHGSDTANGVYGGSSFCLLLWMYWSAAALSLAVGLFHISRGEVQRHRSWMSVNYSTALGAPFLRFFWTLYGSFTSYRMDEINMACVILFLNSAVFVACCYCSFAHRKTLKTLGGTTLTSVKGVVFTAAAFGSIVLVNQYFLRFFGTPNLDSLVSGCHVQADAYAEALFGSQGSAGYVAAGLHVCSWSAALMLGAHLTSKALEDPLGVLGVPCYCYVCAIVVAGISTASWFGRLSFSFYLLHPGAAQGHFYKTFPASLWDSKTGLLWIKTAIFMLCAKYGDEQRTLEWLTYSYAEVTFYPFLFFLTWAFQLLLPSESTYEDAWVHAALVAQLAGIIGFYLLLIYCFEPQTDPSISAVRHGLFARHSYKKESLLASS